MRALLLFFFTLQLGNHNVAAQSFVAGHQVFTATDENRSDRELLTNVWYPVDAEDAEGRPPIQYYQHYNGGADFWWFDSPFEGGVQDTPASDAGPFPIVVLSHGTGGYTNSFAHLGEALARAGYVTVAPRHAGNAWGTPDDSNVQRRRSNRGIDLTFITDILLEKGRSEDDLLFGALDETRIAAGGYSAGVPTSASLLLGQNSPGSPVPIDNRPQALLMLDGRLWWSGDEQTVDVPTLLIGATVGNVTSESQFNINSDQRHTIHVENSHHWSFGMNLCQFAEALEDSDAPDAVFATTGDPDREYTEDFWPGCQDHLIDLDESLEIVAEHALEFLDVYLKDGDPIELLPEKVDELRVDSSLRRGDAFVLLTDPSGRVLGENENGDLVDTFESSSTEHLPRTRSHVFSIGSDDLLPGEYTVGGSNPTSENTYMSSTATLHGTTDGHAVTVRVFDGESVLSETDSMIFSLEWLSTADCSSSGRLDAADLACVTTVAQRDLVLDALSLLPGDLNLDGEVDFADFLSLSGSFGVQTGTYLEGNIDLQNGVDFPDFLELTSNFGAMHVSAVSEPAGLSLWGIVACLALAFRSRSDSRPAG